MEMMELNENLMELEFDFDPEIYDQTSKDLEEIEKKLFSEIQEIVGTYNDETAREEELNCIKNYYLKRRYFLRIKENLAKFAPR